MRFRESDGGTVANASGQDSQAYEQQRQHHKRSDSEPAFRLALHDVPNFETQSFTSRRRMFFRSRTADRSKF
jgi:hypothetical protein